LGDCVAIPFPIPSKDSVLTLIITLNSSEIFPNVIAKGTFNSSLKHFYQETFDEVELYIDNDNDITKVENENV
jgi:hypothetical protein